MAYQYWNWFKNLRKGNLALGQLQVEKKMTSSSGIVGDIPGGVV